MPPRDGVTEAISVNHDMSSAMSFKAGGSHEDEEGRADGFNEDE